MATTPDITVDITAKLDALLADGAIAKLALGLAREVAAEISSARAKHGDQKHLPLVFDLKDGRRPYWHEALAAKQRCETKPYSWDRILLEEVYEFLEALEAGNPVEARAEAIQAIAMLTSMVEILDSNALES